MNPWTALLDLLGTILAFFYSLVPNYGVAIILLTILIGAITFPLTLKQTRSMRAMQAIQPQVKKLQQEYKQDRQELNQRLMALYQENNVNPASGCLPLVVQMPIWFALFSVLRTPDRFPDGSALFNVIREPAADITAAADATAKWAIDIPGNLEFLGLNLLLSPSEALGGGGIGAVIPYAILIVIVAASSYYQQYQTQKRRTDDPAAAQTPQAQGMQTALKIMPLFFAFISFNFITGLVLYFATSNVFRIGQQAIIIGLDDREPSDDGANGSASEAEERRRRSGTNPNTSKKRSRRRRK